VASKALDLIFALRMSGGKSVYFDPSR